MERDVDVVRGPASNRLNRADWPKNGGRRKQTCGEDSDMRVSKKIVGAAHG